MPQNLLTERTIRSAKAKDKEYSLADGEGLELRIKPSGVKSWRLRYTRNSRAVKKTLGTYPEVSLAKARELSQAERLNIQLRNEANSSTDAPQTLDELFSRWYESYILPNRKSDNDRKAVRSRYVRYVQGALGDLELHRIRRGMLTHVLDNVVSKGTNRQANILLAELKQMFTYAAVREWILGDPLVGLGAKDVGGRKKRSTRILSEDELRVLKEKISQPDAISNVSLRLILPWRTELAVWLALSTLARSIEVATARAEDLDLVSGTWTIPAEVCKNGTEHLVHLNCVSRTVFGILLSRQSEGYLFRGRHGRSHIQASAFTRELTDRQGREKPLAGRRNSTELVLPGGHWSMHDLRRTGATMLGEMGYDSDLIDLCLNHKEANDVTATYQLQKRLPERKAAFEALGEKIIQVVGGYDFLSTLESRLTARRRSGDQSVPDEETCPPSSGGTQSDG